VKWWQSFKKIY